jgi:hypothetical protein
MAGLVPAIHAFLATRTDSRASFKLSNPTYQHAAAAGFPSPRAKRGGEGSGVGGHQCVGWVEPRIRGETHRWVSLPLNPSYEVPHTSFATSTTIASFAHCSSSASTLPSSVEAKPHCGERHSWSRSANFAASSMRRLI